MFGITWYDVPQTRMQNGLEFSYDPFPNDLVSAAQHWGTHSILATVARTLNLATEGCHLIWSYD